MDYILRITEIANKFENDIQDVVDAFQENILEPFCKKYRLNFYQGNGAWIFEDIDKKFDISCPDLDFDDTNKTCSFHGFYLSEDSRLNKKDVQKKFLEELYSIASVMDKHIIDAGHFHYGLRTIRVDT
jgi:hypothetical protein